MDTIESDRLLLRPFTWDDFDFLDEMNADPDVARFIGHGRPRSRSESQDWMEKTLRWYEEDRTGHLAVVLKQTSALIGRCGLSRFDVEIRTAGMTHPLRCYWGPDSAPGGVENERILELGYAFGKAHWGNGYATEAACAMRDDTFSTRQNDVLMSLILPGNHASKRVAFKTGLRQHDRVEVFGSLADRFLMTRADWERTDSGRRR